MATVAKSCKMKPNIAKPKYRLCKPTPNSDNCCMRQTMYKGWPAASSYIQDSGNVQCAIKAAHWLQICCTTICRLHWQYLCIKTSLSEAGLYDGDSTHSCSSGLVSWIAEDVANPQSMYSYVQPTPIEGQWKRRPPQFLKDLSAIQNHYISFHSISPKSS